MAKQSPSMEDIFILQKQRHFNNNNLSDPPKVWSQDACYCHWLQLCTSHLCTSHLCTFFLCTSQPALESPETPSRTPQSWRRSTEQITLLCLLYFICLLKSVELGNQLRSTVPRRWWICALTFSPPSMSNQCNEDFQSSVYFLFEFCIHSLPGVTWRLMSLSGVEADNSQKRRPVTHNPLSLWPLNTTVDHNEKNTTDDRKIGEEREQNRAKLQNRILEWRYHC